MITHVLMEENYMTLSTEYSTIKEKEDFLESVNAAVKIFKLTPDIYVKPFSHDEPGKGKVVIEFGSNGDRNFGVFFEYLIHDNNLVCK